MTGSITKRNHFYFGNIRNDNKHSFWRLNLKILNVLKKYQEKYNIIIKDYFDGQKSLWKEMLFDTESHNIKYIGNEITVAEIANTSDLIILPWFSTTFYESLYSSADIFLLEKEIIDELKDEKITNEVFSYDNENKFLSDLEDYLNKGIFNQKIKISVKKIL